MDELTGTEKTIGHRQNRYYGKYRAVVVDNRDPQTRGRCKLSIPSVLGETDSAWALPCFAYGGGQGFGVIAVPPVNAQVIAEFMEGDLSSPLWTGAFWRTSDEVPEEFTSNNEPTAKVLKTERGHVLVFEDADGDERITLKSAAEAVLEMDSNGSFALTDSGGATVTLDASSNEIKIEDTRGNSMVMSSSGIALTDSSGNQIKTTSGGISIKAPATVTIDAGAGVVAVGGSGGEPLVKGTSFLASFNSHTHLSPGSGQISGPPIVPLTPGVLTTKTTAR